MVEDLENKIETKWYDLPKTLGKSLIPLYVMGSLFLSTQKAEADKGDVVNQWSVEGTGVTWDSGSDNIATLANRKVNLYNPSTGSLREVINFNTTESDCGGTRGGLAFDNNDTADENDDYFLAQEHADGCFLVGYEGVRNVERTGNSSQRGPPVDAEDWAYMFNSHEGKNLFYRAYTNGGSIGVLDSEQWYYTMDLATEGIKNIRGICPYTALGDDHYGVVWRDSAQAKISIIHDLGDTNFEVVDTFNINVPNNPTGIGYRSGHFFVTDAESILYKIDAANSDPTPTVRPPTSTPTATSTATVTPTPTITPTRTPDKSFVGESAWLIYE